LNRSNSFLIIPRLSVFGSMVRCPLTFPPADPALAESLRFPEPRQAGYFNGLSRTPLDKGAVMPFQRRQLLRILSFAFGSSFIEIRSQLGIAAQTARDGISVGTEREKVTGIGGLFFRAQDPKALALWYQENLRISTIPTGSGDSVWQQEAGPTAFAPFKETTSYFGDPEKRWMVNFRVRDLDKMAAQLQAAGIAVKVDPQLYPNGRFAR